MCWLHARTGARKCYAKLLGNLYLPLRWQLLPNNFLNKVEDLFLSCPTSRFQVIVALSHPIQKSPKGCSGSSMEGHQYLYSLKVHVKACQSSCHGKLFTSILYTEMDISVSLDYNMFAV
ncbi:hypothetical protein Cni_G22918 [Canna indica]|uniref:Uncharacterized protein n=1 Tax=Canna indica TaxID=4628 RepID=A0AAQ3KW26_9LILI|nr:hypothetical protein Cni_G22918 [Canna indica]